MSFGAPFWNGSWINYPVRIVITPRGAGVGHAYVWGGNLGMEPGQPNGYEPTGQPTDTQVVMHWVCDRDYYGSGSGRFPIVVELGVFFNEIGGEGVHVFHTVDLEADCAAVGHPMSPDPNLSPPAPPPCIVTPQPSPTASSALTDPTAPPAPVEGTASPPPC